MNKSQASKFIAFLSGSTLLLFSEGLYDLAFAIYAFQISGKASVGAITYALGYAAEILVSLFGGGFLDRRSKWRIYFVTISLKILAFAVLVFWGHNRGLNEITIWIFAFLIDAIHHYSKLNNIAAIKDLFKATDLAKAHGLLAAVQGSSRIIGPVIGAAIVGWLGAIDALIFCSLFQILALAFYYLAFRDQDSKMAAHDGTFHDALFGVTRALREVMRSPGWRKYFFLDACSTLLSGTSVLLMVPLVKVLFNAPDNRLGVFFGMGAAGSVVAGILLSRVHSHLSLKNAIPLAVGLQSIFLVFLVTSGSLWAAAIAKLFLDMAMTTYFRSTAIFIQTHAPQDKVATYFSAADATARVFGLTGVLSAGFLFDRFGYAPVFGLLSLGLITLSLIWSVTFPRINAAG